EERRGARQEDDQPRRLEAPLRRHEDEAPEDERDEGRERIEPHPERTRSIRETFSEEQRPRDLRDERNERADGDDRLQDVAEPQEGEERREDPQGDERHVGVTLLRVKPRERAEELAVAGGGPEDARVAERQREDRRERGPKNEEGDGARQLRARDGRDEV